MRVFVISAGGGAPRLFADTMVSDHTGALSWAPGRAILYHRPGHSNYHILDPATGMETPLLEDDSVGWIFEPRASPDGTRLAVAWNRRKAPLGVWTLSADGRDHQQVSARTAFPLGWSRDGRLVLAVDMPPAKPSIFSIPVDGGEEATLAELPFNSFAERAAMASDGRSFVFSVADSRSDVWVMENFDPDAE